MTQISEEVANLEHLAAELSQRRPTVQVITSARRPYPNVANTDTPQLGEQVTCQRDGDSAWCYWWSWRQPIGPVHDLETVAGKIAAVLRPVEGRS